MTLLLSHSYMEVCVMQVKMWLGVPDIRVRVISVPLMSHMKMELCEAVTIQPGIITLLYLYTDCWLDMKRNEMKNVALRLIS